MCQVPENKGSKEECIECVYMEVSKNRVGPPNHPFVHRVFHYKPSILGYQYFWKRPYINTLIHVNDRSVSNKYIPNYQIEMVERLQ